QIKALQEQADLFSESDLVRFFHALAETEASLKEAANPRYQVEVGLVKLMEMRRLASLSDLVGRIAELESALRTGRPPAERKNPQATPSAASNASTRSTSTASTSAAEPGTANEATTPPLIAAADELTAPAAIA